MKTIFPFTQIYFFVGHKCKTWEMLTFIYLCDSSTYPSYFLVIFYFQAFPLAIEFLRPKVHSTSNYSRRNCVVSWISVMCFATSLLHARSTALTLYLLCTALRKPCAPFSSLRSPFFFIVPAPGMFPSLVHDSLLLVFAIGRRLKLEIQKSPRCRRCAKKVKRKRWQRYHTCTFIDKGNCILLSLFLLSSLPFSFFFTSIYIY